MIITSLKPWVIMIWTSLSLVAPQQVIKTNCLTQVKLFCIYCIIPVVKWWSLYGSIFLVFCTISWIDADPVHWHIYAALGGDELIFSDSQRNFFVGVKCKYMYIYTICTYVYNVTKIMFYVDQYLYQTVMIIIFAHGGCLIPTIWWLRFVVDVSLHGDYENCCDFCGLYNSLMPDFQVNLVLYVPLNLITFAKNLNTVADIVQMQCSVTVKCNFHTYSFETHTRDDSI